MNRLLAAAALAVAPTLAQIPHDHLIYAHRTGSTTLPPIGILDPGTGTATPLLPRTGAFTTSGSRTVAIDPQAPATVYTSSLLSISIAASVTVMALDGNVFTRTNLNLTGVNALPFRLRWAPGYGLLVLARGGAANRMFLRDMATGTVTGQPTATLLPREASDMVFLNGKAYASSEGDGTAILNGTIVEWDLATNTDRVVGSAYPPLSGLAAFAGQILAGDTNGNLHVIDPQSGTSTPLLATGLGKILSIAVDSAMRVFVLVENGSSWSVHDAFNPAQPIYTTTSPLEDLECGPAPVPTMLTYGAGCAGSNARAPALSWTSMPALGATLGLSLDGGPPNAGSFLVLGSSRVADLLGALPRDLSVLGMPLCTQYVDVLASLFLPLTNAGTAATGIAIPANPVLAGVRMPAQWLVLDPPANSFGATTSNGVEAYVR